MDENMSSQESKPSADVITSLEDKIAYNIFLRLPPKEICYLKTFKKKWNKMLSDPSFNNLYRENSNKNNLKLLSASFFVERGDLEKGLITLEMALFDYEEGTIDYEDVTRKIDKSSLHVLYAGNGNLTCILNGKGFFIFNPTSKRFASLPETSSTIDNVLISKAGFGYVPSRNEYIFVHVFDASQADDEYFDMRCEWLTISEADQEKDLRTSLSWKMLEEPCPYSVRGNGVLIDGLFYFMISDKCDHQVGHMLLSIDLEKEGDSYRIMGHQDETVYDKFNVRFLMDLNGQLCFVEIQEETLVMDLWILTDPENTVQWMKWTNLCSIDLMQLKGFDGKDVSNIALIGLRNGELIFQNLAKNKLDYYDVEEESLREGTVNFADWCQVYLYTQNLSFLNIRSS